MINIYRNHPKKTLLFLTFILGGITIKFRAQLFAKFVQQMQSKLTKEMTMQMEKGQRINSILDKIQNAVDSYYYDCDYLNKITGMLRKEQISELSNQIKNQMNTMTQEQKILGYQKLCNEFLIFEVSSIVLFRYFECMLLLTKIVLLTKELTNEQQQIILNLLDEVQQNILKVQFEIVKGMIQNQINSEPDRYKYDAKIHLHILVRDLVTQCREKLYNFNDWKYIIKNSNEILEKKIQRLQEYNPDQNQNDFKQTAFELLNHLIKINSSKALKTFYFYSINFTYQKMQNRINLLPNSIDDLILIKQLTQHHKILNEEIYNQKSIESNKKYYQKIIKQGLKLKEEDNQSECQELQQISKVIHEHRIYTILSGTQNQIIKKIIFGNELDDQGSSQKQSLGLV